MEQDKNFKEFFDERMLNESSLGRVWQHFNNQDEVIIIMTAFRDEEGNEKNITIKRKTSL